MHVAMNKKIYQISLKFKSKVSLNKICSQVKMLENISCNAVGCHRNHQSTASVDNFLIFGNTFDYNIFYNVDL